MINRGGCTRMYPLYKNAYKRLFRSNIKALKGEKMKEFTSVLLLLWPSSPRNLVGDPLLSKKKHDRFPTTTLGNDIISASGRTATSGFSLIELLVVVLIIGILAAVALPQYETSVAKSRLVQLKILVKSLKDAEELYYMANGSYTQNFEDLDISLPGNQMSNHKELWVITNKVTCSLGSVPRSLHCIGGHSAWEMWLDQTENAPQTLCYAYDDDKAAQKACVNEGGTRKTSIGGENFFYIIEP